MNIIIFFIQVCHASKFVVPTYGFCQPNECHDIGKNQLLNEVKNSKHMMIQHFGALMMSFTEQKKEHFN